MRYGRKFLNGKPMSDLERRFASKRQAKHIPVELWKFQRPLFPPDGDVMVHNEGKRNTIILSSHQVAGLYDLFEGHYKFYAWAQFNSHTQAFKFDRSRPFIFDEAEFPEW